jgi:hypothetical protein
VACIRSVFSSSLGDGARVTVVVGVVDGVSLFVGDDAGSNAGAVGGGAGAGFAGVSDCAHVITVANINVDSAIENRVSAHIAVPRTRRELSGVVAMVAHSLWIKGKPLDSGESVRFIVVVTGRSREQLATTRGRKSRWAISR